MIKYSLLAASLLLVPAAHAEDALIEGNIQSKCIINTDVNGVYGNPSPSKLSTISTDGGVEPIIRFDVAVANFYLARITTPTMFSTAPALTDVVNWTGSTVTGEVSDAAMSAYDAAKVVYEATTEFDLTVAGSTWFKVSSVADYGFGRSFPGGTYRAVVQAECIAQ
tara:strand:+ start:1607 stop:2104 length:498 start_codon:yes stop_codon:yes gene_type:complete